MLLKYLGTAAYEGIPAIFCPCETCQNARKLGGREIRTRCGALLDGKIKIDFPPDSYMHLLRDGLDYSEIKTLLITHTHSDHFAVLDIQARVGCYAQLPETAEALHVYGNASMVKMAAECIEEVDERRLQFHEVKPFVPFEAEGYIITALKASHMLGSSETPFFYLIEKDGKKLLYAHDTGAFPEESFEYLRGKQIDCLSLDCTGGYIDAGRGHMDNEQCRAMKKRLLESGAAKENAVFVLNHFSHNGKATYAGLCAEMEGEFLVSYDSMELEI